MNDDETEYSFLVTRASEYKKAGETLPSTNTSTPVWHPKKLPKRYAVYMKCRDHCPITRASKKTDISGQIWTHNVVLVLSMKFEKNFAVAFFQDRRKFLNIC